MHPHCVGTIDSKTNHTNPFVQWAYPTLHWIWGLYYIYSLRWLHPSTLYLTVGHHTVVYREGLGPRRPGTTLFCRGLGICSRVRRLSLHHEGYTGLTPSLTQTRVLSRSPDRFVRWRESLWAGEPPDAAVPLGRRAACFKTCSSS